VDLRCGLRAQDTEGCCVGRLFVVKTTYSFQPLSLECYVEPAGCCAIFQRIIGLAKVHLPDDKERNAFVHLPPATINGRIAADIEERQPIDTIPSVDEECAKIDPENVPYLLSTLKDKWVNDHKTIMDEEHSRLAERYEAWKKARKTAEASDGYEKIQTPSMANDYKDGESYVNNRVIERTCHDTKVFAAKSSMVHQLREEDCFKPDVLVFDECFQAIEPALLAAHMKGIKRSSSSVATRDSSGL
jgi:hypothetical protein